MKAVVLTGVSQSVCQTSSTAPGFVSDNAFDAVFGNSSTSQSKLSSQHGLDLVLSWFIREYFLSFPSYTYIQDPPPPPCPCPPPPPSLLSPL